MTLEDAKQKLERAQAMFEKELVPKTDLEAAEVAVKSAEAQIKSSEASLTQTQGQPESGAGQPELHRHHLAHRRHRHLAQRGPGPDGRRRA